MDFSRSDILPKGRRKYGEYGVSTSSILKNAQTIIYKGTGGGSSEPGEGILPDKPAEENYFMFLSKTYGTFDRNDLGGTGKTDTINVIAYSGTSVTATYIGDLSGEIVSTGETGSTTYDITGLTTGITVTVSGNGSTACTITVKLTSNFADSGGTLQIPVNVSNCGVDLGNSYISWKAENDVNSQAVGHDGTLFSTILTYTFVVDDNTAAASAFVMNLTNDSAGINVDSDGDVLPDALRPVCQARVYYGLTDITTAVTFTASTNYEAAATGVTVNSSGTLILRDSDPNNFNFLGSSLEIYFQGNISGVTLYKTMTITKQYPGKDGTGATTRWIKLDRDEIKFNPNTLSLTPSTINARIFKQVNEEQPVEDTATTLYYGWETDTPTNTGKTNTNITVLGGYEYLSVGLKNASNVFYELETVPVLEEGTNGEDGQPGGTGPQGESAYILLLDNQFQFVNVDSGGTVISGQESNLRTTATLYYGKDPATGVSYSIRENFNDTIRIFSDGDILFYSGWGSYFTGNTMTITVNASVNSVTRGEAKYILVKNYPPASNPYVLDLSMENTSVNMDKPRADLTSKIYASSISRLSGITATLYYGDDEATGVSYSLGGSYTGVSINSSTGVLSFTSAGTNTFKFNGDNLDIIVVASVGGTEKGRKTLTVSKVYPGTNGEDGGEGNDATSYWGNLSAKAIHVNSGGTCTPTALTITVYEQTGDNDPVTSSSITCKYGFDTTSPTLTSWPIIVTAHTGNTYITIVGIHNTDNIERFRYTVPIVKDGDKGDSGESATKYWLVLSASAVHMDSGATEASPSAITATAMQQTGGDEAVPASGYSILYGFNTIDPYLTYPSTGITIDKTKKYLTIKLNVNNVQYDIQTIPILKDGADGESIQGRAGAAIRGPYEWTGAMSRRFSSGEGPEEEDFLFKDIIFRMVNGSKVYYYCNTSYSQTGNTTWSAVSSAWTQSSENYDFIAANLILAENAKINFMSGNEIYVLTSGNTPVVCGGLRGVSGNTDVVIWAGADAPGNAPFRVTYDGRMVATQGTFGPYTIGTDSAGTNSLTGIISGQTGVTKEIYQTYLNPEHIYFKGETSGSSSDYIETVSIMPNRNTDKHPGDGTIDIQVSNKSYNSSCGSMMGNEYVEENAFSTNANVKAHRYLGPTRSPAIFSHGGQAVMSPLLGIEITFMTSDDSNFDRYGTWRINGVDTTISAAEPQELFRKVSNGSGDDSWFFDGTLLSDYGVCIPYAYTGYTFTTGGTREWHFNGVQLGYNTNSYPSIATRTSSSSFGTADDNGYWCIYNSYSGAYLNTGIANPAYITKRNNVIYIEI